MADSHTGASVVHVDGASEAAKRDLDARRLLDDGGVPRVIVAHASVRCTVPLGVKIACDVNASAQVRHDLDGVLDGVFATIDATLNSFNPQSEVSHINAEASTTKVFNISRGMADCLRVAKDVGRVFSSYDVACAPLAALLRQAAKNGVVPARARVDAVAAYSSWENGFEFVLDPPPSMPAGEKAKFGPTLRKKHALAALDFGSVAKGYAVDRIVDAFVARGWKNALVEWGGDCRAVGTNHRGDPWHVAIQRPPSLHEIEAAARTATEGKDRKDVGAAPPTERQFLQAVALRNEAIATSGDYEQIVMFRSQESQLAVMVTTLCDPRTRRLLEPSATLLAQVTVKSSSAAYADAYATAALIHRSVSDLKWRFPRRPGVANVASDYFAYIREDERIAIMHETSHESSEMRALRLAQSLPARVVIVGGGLAGQCAAIEAARSGASVVLLEKAERLGGNSAKATSGINACSTIQQGERGITDDATYFERDTFRSGIGGSCDIGLVKMAVAKSADAIRWLSSNFGIPLSIISQLGGHARPRTHRAPDQQDGTPVPIGYTIMQTLERYIRTHLSTCIKIVLNSPVTTLLHETISMADGSKRVRVRGVVYRHEGEEDVQLLADAVVLATGGFSSDHSVDSLLKEFAPQLLETATTNGSFATGDGVKMARAIGAHLVDMQHVQLHPTAFVDPKDPKNATKYLGPEALRGSGGILINRRGERFINELDLRSVVSQAIEAQGDMYAQTKTPVAYCVLNNAAADAFGRGSLRFYHEKLGLFTQCSDVAELAKVVGCSADVLRATLEAYEKSCTAGRCTTTGKRVFPTRMGIQGPFLVSIVTPAIHYTMGGCNISPSGEVQALTGTDGIFGRRRPIQGLLAAGEVTGGLHGKNRLGGNSLLECVVFGRIAGDRAGTILQRLPHGLSFKRWTTVVLREVREGGVFGVGSRVLRFNLPGALQSSGLLLGQFVAIRGKWDGQLLMGYYSPITLPDDLGVIGILARVDKGSLREWIAAMGPGDAVEMRGCGGLQIERHFASGTLRFGEASIRRLGMVAGGTGIAPMLQLLRACVKAPFRTEMVALRLIYAAEEEAELTYKELLRSFERQLQSHHGETKEGKRVTFECVFTLNRPPPGWTGEVGFVDKGLLSRALQPPSSDHLIVLCGPPRMQQAVRMQLLSLGHRANLVRTIDDAQPSPL